MRTKFQWDSNKRKSNLAKHRIDFNVAAVAFDDPFHVSKPDQFVDGELRWKTFGQVNDVTLLLVIHVTFEEQLDGEVVEVIRIISARVATKHERREYENG
jgi:uncharacterized DUF497 family protein